MTGNRLRRQLSDRTRRAALALGALACAIGLTFAAAIPANAAGMKAITGNIACIAYPNVTVGTSATARGDVYFQLNAVHNTKTLYYQYLGYSGAYSNWSWKFWTSQAGNFYAYGTGGAGNVTTVSRWCHNIGG